MKGARSHIACERWEQTYTCTILKFNNLTVTIMATVKKLELTLNQLWVLKYILHEVDSSEEGANRIYLTPKERVSLRQIRSKL